MPIYWENIAVFKHEAKYQLAPFLGPVVLGLWAGIFLPVFGPFGLMVISFAAIGFGFLLYAKLSEKKRTKKLISWGSGAMIFREKTSYFIGCLMSFSCFVLSVYLSLYPPGTNNRGW